MRSCKVCRMRRKTYLACTQYEAPSFESDGPHHALPVGPRINCGHAVNLGSLLIVVHAKQRLNTFQIQRKDVIRRHLSRRRPVCSFGSVLAEAYHHILPAYGRRKYDVFGLVILCLEPRCHHLGVFLVTEAGETGSSERRSSSILYRSARADVRGPLTPILIARTPSASAGKTSGK